MFAGFGACVGKLTGTTRTVQSTVHPGEAATAYNVFWDVDQSYLELEEEELRPLIVVRNMTERKRIIDGLNPAFEYLESRIAGSCDNSQYSCEHMHKVSVAPQSFTCAVSALTLSVNTPSYDRFARLPASSTHALRETAL